MNVNHQSTSPKEPFRKKNEVTRHFEEIMEERGHPDSKELARMKQNREERTNHSDKGL